MSYVNLIEDYMRDSRVKGGDTIVVWFSCGAASAIALKITMETYPDCKVIAVNNPVKDEDDDNQRFLSDVSKWLDIEVSQALNEKYPSASCVEVWEKSKFMSAPYGAPCTTQLKKEARKQWEAKNHFDWLVLGFTMEEKHRAERFKLGEREELLTPLIDNEITKGDCFNALFVAGVELPAIYRRGYPNANCIGCVKSNSPTYWNHVRKQDPDKFQERAEQSRRLGARLVKVKGERIFLDELKETDQGRPMKDMDFECGIFCEEKL